MPKIVYQKKIQYARRESAIQRGDIFLAPAKVGSFAEFSWVWGKRVD